MRWGNTAHLPADELPVLKARLGELCRIGAQTHLTPMETRLLIAFARLRPPHTEDRLLGCLYHCPDCESSNSENVLTVMICRLRAKMRPFGLKIISDWNGHYQLGGDLHLDWRGYNHLLAYGRPHHDTQDAPATVPGAAHVGVPGEQAGQRSEEMTTPI